MTAESFAEVAVFLPLPNTLSYRLPPDLTPLVRCGSRVVVPVGTKRVVGVVTELGPEPSAAVQSIKPVTEVLDLEPVLEGELLELLLWTARYYFAPPGEVVRAALPPALHARERQLLRLTSEGERVLAAQQAILRAPEDDLLPLELRLLERLRAKRGGLSLAQVQSRGRASLVARLAERGLLTLTAHRADPASTRTDLLLETVPGAEADSLSRAPRQAALLRDLQARGGRALLSSLSPSRRDARALANKLAERGLIRIEERELPRDPFASEPVEPDCPPLPTDEQRAALEVLLEANRRQRFASFLLHGVTGSGKTEVYLRLIAQNLELGRDALVLVPEISLTPQLAARFRARFGEQVAVLHSGLTDSERLGQWRRIRSAQVRIVVGARSAVFAPLSRLGVIIVDEEHDTSFKQAEGVHYNGRDVALVRAKRAQAVAVLGSATPSLESYSGAELGRLRLLELRQRATPRPLPEVQVVDLRTYRTGPEGILSAPLAEALQETLDAGEQAILFLNRRGFSSFVLCRACGHAFRCEHCSVSLTYHRSIGRLLCHYCGYTTALSKECPVCGEARIALLGLGTEQVEQVIQARFADARVARLDRDTASSRGMRSILAEVGRREVDVLIGTQMVTKGHDFPHVTLVGVVCADLGLQFPDFRSAEHTFQLLTQVAGRAGRGERPGRVMVQTYNPEHPSIVAAQAHDYCSFYAGEIAARRELGYPPYAHLAAVRVDGADAMAVAAAARRVADRGRTVLRESGEAAQLLGPAEAPLQRLKGKTRWLVLIKAEKRPVLRRIVEGLLPEAGVLSGGIRVTVDVDPLFML